VTKEIMQPCDCCVARKNVCLLILHCFDTVGWVRGRASRL